MQRFDGGKIPGDYRPRSLKFKRAKVLNAGRPRVHVRGFCSYERAAFLTFELTGYGESHDELGTGETRGGR